MPSDWTDAWEQSPANSDAISEGAGKIRDTRETVGNALAIDHFVMESDGTAESKIGQHKQVTLYVRSAPTGATDTGTVWIRDGAGGTSWPDDDTATDCTDLWYTNEKGSVRLTRTVGTDVSLDVIPKDTVMIFYQSIIPAGWEQLTGESGTQAADSLFAPTYTDAASTPSDPDKGGEVVSGGDAIDGKFYNWSLEGIGSTLAEGYGKTEDFTLTEEHIPEHVHTAYGQTYGDAAIMQSPGFSVWSPISNTGAWGGDEAGDTTPHGHDIRNNTSTPWRPVISVCLVCKKL